MGRWEIPNNWEWVKVGEIAKVIGGGTPSTRISQNFSEDTGIAWLTPADLSGYEGTYIKRGKRNITQAGYDSSSAVLMPPGTVLYTSRAPIGYCVIAENEIATNQGFKSFVLLGQTVPEYIRYYLVSSKEYAESFASGTTFKELSGSRIKELLIPLLPLNEQKRVSQKIKALQARSSKVRNALKTIPPLLEKFRQSVLASAFRGDLTADWRAQNPDIEPATKLLERIRKERRKRWEENELAKMKAKGKTPKDGKWKKKYKEPEPVDTADLPELPEGWCWVSLPECGEMSRGKSKHRPRNDPRLLGGKYPFIQTGEVSQAKGHIKNATIFYSEFGLQQSRLFPAGTVCITIAANIAETAVLDIDACFPDSVVGVIVDNRIISPDYLEFYIRTIRDDLATFAPATAQKNINIAILNKIAVPIPSEKERVKIEHILSQSLKSANNIESQYVELVAGVNKLDQSILSKAFRGELVPQDPNDESASELLKRIKQEKASREAEKKKRGKAGCKKATRKDGATSMAKKKERRPFVEVLQPHSSSLFPKELFQEDGIHHGGAGK